MEKKTKNYAWFYSLLKANPYADKESLVLQYTDGRTSSLREMSSAEYEAMCRDLERGSRSRAEEDRTRLKKARSAVLLRLARLGLDTVDNWDGIDAFCMSPKIASLQMSMATAIARPASSPEKAPVALVLLQKIPMRNVATIGGEMYDSISW